MNKEEINLELLAKVIGAYSISHAKQTEEGLNITYREHEEDSSSWDVLDVFMLAFLYKDWVLHNLNLELVSWTSKQEGGYCVSYEPSSSFDDFEDSITASNEIRAIRLMAEIMYERSL